MPSIMPIKILGHVKFSSHMLKLPPDSEWQQPQGNPAAQQYNDALDPAEKIAIPKVFPPYFLPQNMQKYHMDACNDIGKITKDFQDTMIDAVKFAHDMWRLSAGFQNLKVMAVSAIGTPGCLKGPSLESLIKTAPMCAAMMGNAATLRDAIAKGVSDCFKKWQDQVTVPGLPWYPAFAAFPGPMPLITCVSAQMAQITVPKFMNDAMVGALSSSHKQKDVADIHVALFDSIATVLSLAFLTWLPSQQVMLVMGMGPIPTFAPPFVPVGPVVNGQNLPGVHMLT